MGKWTRRGFITAGVIAGGALVVGVAIRPGNRAPKIAGMMTEEGETLVNVWVKIAPDNTITAIIPHSEMGQGVFTSLSQMLADEMDADWEKVTYEQAPAHEEYANFIMGREYVAPGLKVPGIIEETVNGAFLTISKAIGLQITGGSMSVRTTGWFGLRAAGAAARELIVRAAASSWNVPETELTTELSHVVHVASGRREPYASFAAEAGQHTPPTRPTLKTPDEFKIMGTSKPRFDIPSKVDGTAEFGIDADLPGMKYAAVMGPPVLGNTVQSVDDSAAASMRGVIKVLNEGDFVAVVADSYWHAQQAVDALNVTWTTSKANTLSGDDVFVQFRADMDKAVADGKEKKDVIKGDARGAAANAASIFEAEYTVPYLAHAAMEPLNATAWIHDGTCELWSGLQNPLGTRNEIAKFLGIKNHNVVIHNCMLGGGFGRRFQQDYPNMAVRIASHFEHPVKMIWSREQDTQQDWYRPATLAKMKAGRDASGKPVSWEHQYVYKHDPAEAPHIAYEIADQFIHYTDSPTHMRFGPWRSVDHTQHGFFIESFIDELAHEAGADPLEFRKGLLTNQPRYLKVLDEVAKASGWGSDLPKGIGRGVAVTDSFGTVVAQVMEVDMTSGSPRVTKVWAAADPGYVMNPDGFTAQIESGIIYGLTAALYGEITLENGAVMQSNFHDYPMIRMNDAPEIHVTLVNSGTGIGGGGEPGTPPVAPALANAVFAATGKRMRSLPASRYLDGGQVA